MDGQRPFLPQLGSLIYLTYILGSTLGSRGFSSRPDNTWFASAAGEAENRVWKASGTQSSWAVFIPHKHYFMPYG